MWEGCKKQTTVAAQTVYQGVLHVKKKRTTLVRLLVHKPTLKNVRNSCEKISYYELPM